MARLIYASLAGLLWILPACVVDTTAIPSPSDGGTEECTSAADCDDGRACTVDTCSASARCVNTPDDSLCSDGKLCRPTLTTDESGCFSPSCDTSACAAAVDGSRCTEGVCVSGRCEEVSSCVPADEGYDASCVAIACDEGTCSFSPLADGTSCDNELFCDGTADTCDGEGHCIGGPTPCVDADQCDEDLDRCVGCLEDSHCPTDWTVAECTWSDAVDDRCVADSGVQLGSGAFCNPDGICVYEDTPTQTRSCEIAQGDSCDDGVACTTGDTCSEGVCGGNQANSYCDDSNDCTQDLCRPNNSAANDEGCLNRNVANGTSCDDTPGDCTVLTCQSGFCQSNTFSCSGSPLNDQCNTAVCQSGSTAPMCVADSTSHEDDTCDDGDFCTVSDSCASGVCSGTPRTCPDPPAADADCRVAQCSGSACGFRNINNGGSCGDPCTGSTCVAGVCTAGTPVDCSGLSSDCSAGMCDSDDGTCYSVDANEAGACDDGDACTVSTTCSSGTCGGGSAMSCPAPTGANRDCRMASCNSSTGCTTVTDTSANGDSCDDSDACTVATTCSAGTCSGSAWGFVLTGGGSDVPEGGSEPFTVALSGRPAANVTVTLSVSPTDEASLSTTSLTFTASNWSNAQTVTISGTADGDADGDQAVTVTLSTSTCGGVSDTLGFTIEDVAAGVSIRTIDGTANESTYTENAEVGVVLLSAPPSGTVTVTLTLSPSSQGYFWDGMAPQATETLTFNNGNWDTEQTVNVYATNDSTMDGDVTVTVTATASGGGAAINGTSDSSTYIAEDDD